MTTYQQKPPTAEAVRWLGDNLAEVQAIFPETVEGEDEMLAIPVPGWMPDGSQPQMIVATGQWAVLPTRNAPLVMDDEAFLATYEAPG